jgi:hypothetical protein
MFYSSFQGGYVSITNYVSGIRRFSHEIQNGRIVVSDTDRDGNAMKHIITAKDGVICTQSTRVNGKLTFFVEYGAVEKEGGKILRFRRGTNRGLDGMSTWRDYELAGDPGGDPIVGTCKTYYRRGRLIWQKFYHKGTRRLAYHFKPMAKRHEVRRANGSLFAVVEGRIDSRNWKEGVPIFCNSYGSGTRFFTGNPSISYYGGGLFVDDSGSCTIYDRQGDAFVRWSYENSQRVGEWVVDGKEQAFINGLQVSKELYDTPPEDLDPVKVMKIQNVDVRSIFIGRIGMDRIMETFDAETLHEERDMALLRMKFPDGTTQPFNILKVVCTTTKQPYYLRVPVDIPECEQARQWTFGVDRGEKHIRFDIET